MANRYKKEEKKRGKPYPTRTLSDKEWNDLMNYYDDTTHSERLKERLAPQFKWLEEREKELKKELEEENKEKCPKTSP